MGASEFAQEPPALVDQVAAQLFDQLSTTGSGSIADFEETLFRALAEIALERADGNISAAARLLGMKRHQFDYRVRNN